MKVFHKEANFFVGIALYKILFIIFQGGPSINVYRELIKSNKMNLMKHAAGIPGIEFERKTLLTSESNSYAEMLICVILFYESLLLFKIIEL